MRATTQPYLSVSIEVNLRYYQLVVEAQCSQLAVGMLYIMALEPNYFIHCRHCKSPAAMLGSTRPALENLVPEVFCFNYVNVFGNVNSFS